MSSLLPNYPPTKSTMVPQERGEASYGTRSSIGDHYKIIGQVLLECERREYVSLPFFPVETLNAEIVNHFRERSVLIPTAILEEYLDDLLDIKITDNTLSISLPLPTFVLQVLFLVVLTVVGTLATIWCASQNLRELSYLLMAGCAFIVATCVNRQWRARRFFLARIIASEIHRRRGRGTLIEEFAPAPALISWANC